MPTIGVFAAIFDEQKHLLFIKHNYGPKNWSTPGGRMESGESPVEALQREVREETGYVVAVQELVGIYAAPAKDDIVLFFRASILRREHWGPDEEIAQAEFFGRDEMPQPIHPRVLRRILDAFAGRTGIIVVFDDQDTVAWEAPTPWV